MGVALAVAASVLAGCGGSALDPADVARANSAALGTSVSATAGPGQTTQVAPGGQPGGVQPVAGGGQVGGEPVTPGGSAGGSVRGSGGGGGAPATGSGVKAGSCAGFKNFTGISDSAITVATIADQSGPVPGIFTPAVQATKAYAAYFNSTSSLCGRKLEVKAYDSQTNTSADQVATQKSCDETFAAVGSMSAFDTGGAATAVKCKIPEIHAIVTNDARAQCGNCFGAEAPLGKFFPNAVPDYFTRTNKPATQKAAMVYVNASAGVDAAKGQVRAEEKRGWKFVYVSPFDIAEFNYGPYVQNMKSKGVRIVQMYGSAEMGVRMARAMESAGFKPDLFINTAVMYDKNYASGGKAVDKSVVVAGFTPFEDAAQNPEMRLYLKWLQQVAPGAQPTYPGLYAWSAARLFVERATALGGRLTRANLVASLKQVHRWTANGLHAPQDVGAKKAAGCVRFLQVTSGKWSSYGGDKYHCGGITSFR
ncbi:ABC-type branched-subunit amino acid transport system substrate-binding protein [Marmoricola sp. OAE513]|uniref:ABC transporter substrate-binding protein n=1 Tax=Marmoricola sp. OAE513 TaxID=2817894 RepID=UPI001AE2532F